MAKNLVTTLVMQGAALVERVRSFLGGTGRCGHADPHAREARDCGTCRARMFRQAEARGQVSYGDRDAHHTDF